VQRGGWLLVDRLTGHVAPINLPEFDVLYSAASWIATMLPLWSCGGRKEDVCDRGANQPTQASIEEAAG
jgi:hypothetical protein